MALTLATELANYAAGIGTQGATLKIDSANKRVGVGTTNPQGPEGSLQVGTGITFFGNTGIISAIGGRFSGDFIVGGTLTYEDVQNVNSSGVGTFSGGINIVGGGLTVTGVSTFFNDVTVRSSDPTLELIDTDGSTTSSLSANSGNIFYSTSSSNRDHIFRGSTTEVVRITGDGNLGINTTNPHHLLTIENAAGAGVANTAILLRNPTTQADSRIGIDFAINAEPYGGSVWDGASIYVANCGVAGVGSIMTATVESGISSTRTYISHEGKIFVDRETWANDPTTGNHPGLDINTRTTTDNGDTTYATGIDFRVENIHKKRLAVTKGDGSVGDGDWIIYRDNGTNEALRIDSSGRVMIGTQTVGPTGAEQLTIEDSSNSGITIRSGTSAAGAILFEDDTADRGEIQYSHNGDFLRIKTAGTERFRIDAGGNLNVTGITTATQLFEGTTRVATTGKAIAMAMLFG